MDIATPGSVPATALARLAQDARAITLDSVPAIVREQAALCILDTVGCMLAGARTAEAGLILACEPGEAGPSSATVVGTGQRRPLPAAIRINGYLGDVLELNDLIGGHASIGNVAAALALAEVQGASGARLIEAVIRGIEVTTRIYGAVYPTLKRFTEVGMVPVGLPSAVGAAVASAHLLDLDAHATLQAMAIAGGLSGWCPAEVIFGQGGTMKPLLFGAQPGATGVTAALYARQGMTGPAALLESPTGYFATSSRDGRLASPGGGPWALQEPRRKLHACCGYLHSAVDAVGRLRERLGPALAQGRLEVRVPPYVADVVSKHAPPTSPNDARFHLQYCLALALCGADVILPEHSIALDTHLARADVVAAMARIGVVQDDRLAHYHQCVLSHESASGQRTELAGSAPRGSPQEPLDDDAVRHKFLVLATPVIGAPAAQAFVAQSRHLQDAPDLRGWLALVAG